MGLRGVCAVLLAATAVTLSRPGRADLERRAIVDSIQIEGDASCLTKEAVAGRVGRWLSLDRIDARVSIGLKVPSPPNEPVSFVVQRDGAVIAERHFDARPTTCADLLAATSIAIALAIEATVLAPKRELTLEPSPKPKKRVVPDPAVLALEAAVLASVLPKVTFGLGARFDYALVPSFALTLGALGTLAPDVDLGPGAASTRLLAGHLGACGVLVQRPFDLRSCAGIAGGAVLAEGSGYTSQRSLALPWLAVKGRLGARFPISSHLGVDLGANLFAPLVRPQLEVATPAGDVVFRRPLPAVGAGGELGIAANF